MVDVDDSRGDSVTGDFLSQMMESDRNQTVVNNVVDYRVKVQRDILLTSPRIDIPPAVATPWSRNSPWKSDLFHRARRERLPKPTVPDRPSPFHTRKHVTLHRRDPASDRRVVDC